MAETYAFLAMFIVQILAMSVVHPAWLIRNLRIKINPPEPAAREYVARRLSQYRMFNTAVAVLGLMLLGGLFSYMRNPDWDDGPVEALLTVYFMLQMVPIIVVACFVAKINKQLALSASTRKASLLPRRLFDFVSPFVVFLAIACYVLFVALVLLIEQDPFPGFAGAFTNIAIVTTGYAFLAFGVYMVLYRTRGNPLESQAERMHGISVQLRILFYTYIAAVVFVMLNMILILQDLQRWEPFGHSVFYVLCALFYLNGLSKRPRGQDVDGLSASPSA